MLTVGTVLHSGANVVLNDRLMLQAESFNIKEAGEFVFGQYRT